MLIEILKIIFDNNEFIEKIVEYKEYKCSLFYKKNEDNFFVILDKKTIKQDELDDLILNGFSELYELLTKLEIINKAFEKNTTLILCLDSNAEQINRIEEDAYLFKKNIIVYSEEMTIALMGLMKDDYSLKNMNKLLNDDTMFENAKKSQNAGYILLSRLFIKLPFLTYERGGRDLENLSEIIQQKSNDEGIEELYKQLIELDINDITYKSLVENKIIVEVEDE